MKYDYLCESCGTEFEIEKSYTDTKPVKCPECSSKKVRKRLTKPSIIFKGSGFTLAKEDKNSKK